MYETINIAMSNIIGLVTPAGLDGQRMISVPALSRSCASPSSLVVMRLGAGRKSRRRA